MKMEQWAKIVRNNPVAFGKEAGFEDLTQLHNKWIKQFLFGKEDYTLQAHRGSYKTTSLGIAIALMLIIYPEKTIILVRKTDPDVKEIIRLVSQLIQSDMFQALSKAINGTHVDLETNSVIEINTNLKTNPSGTSQLLGLGTSGSITGKHADIIITDDIVNLQDRASQAERERTKLFYQELQNIKNRGGRIINAGTPWHKEDAFELMPNIERFDCYSTGLIADKELQALRTVMLPSLFAVNYELRHIASERQLFDAPRIDDGTNTYKLQNGIAHIDASYGGEDGTAFTIMNEDQDGTIYVLGKLWQRHVDECLDTIEALREHHKAGTIYAENNGDKGYLIKKIKEPSQAYHESMNKFIKISTYLKGAWQDIIFIKGTDPDYINQILSYSEFAEHDDAPDSLASIIRIKGNQKTTGTVTSTINALKRLGL
jgi:predicted phage terminase large subunit-like protein